MILDNLWDFVAILTPLPLARAWREHDNYSVALQPG
jgi:hypothetical protein